MRSKKAVYNIISSLSLQVVTLICGLIVPRLIIKNFGSDVNGLVTSITQFLAYISLLEAGFGPVVKSILYKPLAEKNKDEIEKILKASEKFFKVISYIFLAYIFILCVVYPLVVAKEFDELFTLSLVIIIAISTFFEYYFGMTYKLFLQAEQKTYITSVIQICTTILNTIMVVVLVYFGSSIQMVKLVSSFIFIIRPIVQNLYVKKKYNINLRKVSENYTIKEKWNGLSQHIAAVIHNNTDITLLTIFINTIEVSVYSVHYLVVNGIKKIVQSFIGGIDATFGDMIAKNEKKQLNKSFRVYEQFYFTIITVIFSCTMILITPFVKIYTLGIADANYNRPVFAFLMVLGEFIWTIRLPYSSITLAAGHFKETQKGAWIEAIVNIILSILLIHKFGIIGVVIGTVVAMLIRTIEFIYHTNKYILERNLKENIKRIIIVALECAILMLIFNCLPQIEINSYIEWIKYAFIVFIVSTAIVLFINYLTYKNEFKELINKAKQIIIKKRKK